MSHNQTAPLSSIAAVSNAFLHEMRITLATITDDKTVQFNAPGAAMGAQMLCLISYS